MTDLPAVEERRDVDYETFRTEIVPNYRPVVLRGLVRDWPAAQAGAASTQAIADYLRGFDVGKPVKAFVGPPEIKGRYFYREDMSGKNFEVKDSSFREAFEAIVQTLDQPAPPSIYIGSHPVPSCLPGLTPGLRNPLVAPEVEPRIWIGNRSVVAAHYDLSDNIACVLAGRRRFTLFPPDQTANLYVGPLEFTLAGQPCSMVDFAAPDFERYPRFAEALKHAQAAVLEPGDAIYVPYLWWHHVEGLDPFNVLVNYWWCDAESGYGEAFEALVHAIMSVRPVPPKRREAWRAIFDHYVFEKNGDPAAHLPPIAKGILSPSSQRLRAFIRDWLLRMLGQKRR